MAAEILLRNEVGQEIAAYSTTEFTKDFLVTQNGLNEGTPKKKLFKEIPYQSEANHEVVVGIVGCGIEGIS
jgi:hypothetical protein